MSGIEEFCAIDFDISKIVLCALVRAGSGTPTHRNRASHGLVLYPEGGCEFIFGNGKRIFTTEWSIIYLPKGSDYNVASVSHHDCYAINFDVTTPFEVEPFIRTVRNNELFLDLFKKADKSFKAAKVGYVMECKSILCGIISALQYEVSLGYISSSEQGILAPAIDKIHESYTEDTPSIPLLSGLCGISEGYFRLLFRKSFGKSPIKYVNDLRLSRARELILSGMYSVSQAAQMSGFSDISYFSRAFKKRYGENASDLKGFDGV